MMKITKAIRRKYYDDDKNWIPNFIKLNFYKVENLEGSNIYRFCLNHKWMSLNKETSKWFTENLFTLDEKWGCQQFSMSYAEIDERLKTVDETSIRLWLEEKEDM